MLAHRVLIVGTGSIGERHLRCFQATGRWRSCERAAEPWVKHGAAAPPDRDAPFVRQANAFLDAIEGKASPPCTLEEGARTLRASLAILASVDAGRWVSAA